MTLSRSTTSGSPTRAKNQPGWAIGLSLTNTPVSKSGVQNTNHNRCLWLDMLVFSSGKSEWRPSWALLLSSLKSCWTVYLSFIMPSWVLTAGEEQKKRRKTASIQSVSDEWCQSVTSKSKPAYFRKTTPQQISPGHFRWSVAQLRGSVLNEQQQEPKTHQHLVSHRWVIVESPSRVEGDE